MIPLATIIIVLDSENDDAPKIRNAMAFANAPNAMTFRLPNFSKIKPRTKPPGMAQRDEMLTEKIHTY